MIDESALASGIYEALSKCLVLRDKYQTLSRQGDKHKLQDDVHALLVPSVKLPLSELE